MLRVSRFLRFPGLESLEEYLAERSAFHMPALRVGGVPQHFNTPFHLAKQRHLYKKAGFEMQWTMYPGGTGAMAAALEASEIDVAVMLSEGAVAKVAAGSPLQLCGTYVDSPLTWGVHVKQDCGLKCKEELKGKTFGVSQMGNGSHLSAAVMAHDFGWTLETDVPFNVVGSLDGACKAMAGGEMDAWLGEKFTTKYLVDSGEWDRIGEVTTPWPCLSFVSSKKSLEKLHEPIQQLIAVTRGVCKQFKQNAGDSTVRYVSENHKLSIEDAQIWLDGTTWSCCPEVAPTALDKIVTALTRIGQVPEGWQWSEDAVLAPGMCRLRELPATKKNRSTRKQRGDPYRS
mmetsp:Transcript_128600/g.250616  ORF Transcript_128600/g.250616 Transcript_128600/m.250616 type:complete len:343 (-) Transcript_128600:54-1082(-)